MQGLAEGTPIGRVYHWVYYDRDAEQIFKFGFKAMGKDGNKGFRSFEQGELWFDDSEAGLTLDENERAYTFVVNAVEVVPKRLVDQVQAFLRQELGKITSGTLLGW